jgi:MFS family permease
MSHPESLWQNRDFVRYAVAQLVSLLGSTITNVTLPILVFQRTGSALQTALIASLTVVPYLLFGLLAGAVADRINRRRLMIVCDLLNTALLATIPIAGWLGQLTLPHIYLVAFLSATAFVWFDAANFGALPAIVGRERIAEANSLLWSASTLCSILGPTLGGALAATLGPEPTILLDVLSYALSGSLLWSLRRSFNLTPPSATKQLFRSLGSDIWAGLVFIWRQPLVRTMTLLGIGHSLTAGAVTGLLVVYGVQGLGLAERDPRLGTLFTAGALGSLLASLLLPWLTRRFRTARVSLLGYTLNPLVLALLIAAPTYPLALPAYAIWSVVFTLVIVNAITLRQTVTPDDLQSRVNTTARMIAWGGAPFGAAIGGLLAEWSDIRTAWLIMGGIVLLCAVLAWLSPLRTSEQ